MWDSPICRAVGLRMTMTVIPVMGLIAALFWFKKRFILTDEKVAELAEQVRAKRSAEA